MISSSPTPPQIEVDSGSQLRVDPGALFLKSRLVGDFACRVLPSSNRKTESQTKARRLRHANAGPNTGPRYAGYCAARSRARILLAGVYSYEGPLKCWPGYGPGVYQKQPQPPKHGVEEKAAAIGRWLK